MPTTSRGEPELFDAPLPPLTIVTIVQAMHIYRASQKAMRKGKKICASMPGVGLNRMTRTDRSR
jgi:hypothetical protein